VTAAVPAEVLVAQRSFDPLGPDVHAVRVRSGRTVRMIDEGDQDWPAMLFFGGAGTSVRAFGLFEFARSRRCQLGVRVVSVERNGLGQTPFDPSVGFAEHAADVWSVLDRLGITTASLVAISGGGPYAAHVASAAPGRVRSLHLACTVGAPPGPGAFDVAAVAADPVRWWAFPAGSPTRRIPGFTAATVDEAVRARFALGRDTPPDGLEQASALYAGTALPELSLLPGPVFLYWGEADATVPLAHLDSWRAVLPPGPTVRLYPGEGHDVHYRHWDQILADVATLGYQIVVTRQGQTRLVGPARAADLLARGGSPGLAAWA
jgi:non-heme chloroperoxidase